MKVLKPLAATGTGKIAAILPDTTSSTRYVRVRRAVTEEGDGGRRSVDVATSSSRTRREATRRSLTDAKADITNGAKVLLIDAGGLRHRRERSRTYAKAHGVKVVDYDRLTLGRQPSVLRQLQQRHVGKLIGQGFVSCVKAWHVAKPNVDRDARRRDRQQRDAVLRRATTRCWLRTSKSGQVRTWRHRTAGTWDAARRR